MISNFNQFDFNNQFILSLSQRDNEDEKGVLQKKMERIPKERKGRGILKKRGFKNSQAWNFHRCSNHKYPISKKIHRLMELILAMNAFRKGTPYGNKYRSFMLEVPDEEIQKIISLAAETHGLPAAITAYSRIQGIKG